MDDNLTPETATKDNCDLDRWINLLNEYAQPFGGYYGPAEKFLVAYDAGKTPAQAWRGE